MIYAEMEHKRKYYHANKHRLPREVARNYEAAFRIEYTHNSTAIEVTRCPFWK